MDSPMLAERGWCTAGSSRGKRTDTSGCSGGRWGAERGGVGGEEEGGARVILKSTKPPVGGRGALSDRKPWRDSQSETQDGKARDATDDRGGSWKRGEKKVKKKNKNIFAARWPREAARDSLCAVIIILDSDPRAVK